MHAKELTSGLKSLADLVRQADNFELYSKLLELYSMALELREENFTLKQKLTDQTTLKKLASRIERHTQPFITLKEDPDSLIYCAHCWDVKGKLVQTNISKISYTFDCPECKNRGAYDEEQNAQYLRTHRRVGVSII